MPIERKLKLSEYFYNSIYNIHIPTIASGWIRWYLFRCPVFIMKPSDQLYIGYFIREKLNIKLYMIMSSPHSYIHISGTVSKVLIIFAAVWDGVSNQKLVNQMLIIKTADHRSSFENFVQDTPYSFLIFYFARLKWFKISIAR